MEGKINFSIGQSKSVIGPNAGNVYYRPYLQITGVKTLDDIADHMSEHNSKYDEGDINAVLRQFIKCVCEMIVNGYKVDLGSLGEFRPSIKVKREDAIENVTSDSITDLVMAWTPGSKTKSLRGKAEFVSMPKRKNLQMLKSAEKTGQTSMNLTQSGDSSTSGSVGGSVGGE